MAIRKLGIAVFLVLILLVGVSRSMTGDDNESEGLTFRSSIIGSTPGQMIGGIASGSAPWTVNRASAALDGDGKLHVEIQGLVIVGQGTPAPVTQVLASLVCGGSGGTIMAETAPVNLDAEGDAMIDDTITIPPSCIAPVVLVRVAGVNGTPLPLPLTTQVPFIAATGFTPPVSGSPGHGKGKGHDH
ncbi:MAG: hypothetical protein ACREDR_38305 [Blastocatellia bacterium]